MSNRRLENYVPVHERVYAAAPDIQLLQADPPVMLTETLGYIRVMVTLKDGVTATGIAQFRLDATSGAQKTNPLEDAETSAVGRALAFLGYSADRGIASREDVRRAQEQEQAPRQLQQQQAPAPVSAEVAQARADLKAARAKLLTLGGKPDNLSSSGIQNWSAEELREEIRLTELQIEALEKKHQPGPRPVEGDMFTEAA